MSEIERRNYPRVKTCNLISYMAIKAKDIFYLLDRLCVLAAASCLGEVMTKTEAQSGAGSLANKPINLINLEP